MVVKSKMKTAPAIQPPDGGWGWVIVGCVFFISFLSFGSMFSIGIMFDLLIAEFGCKRSEVSVMASTNFSLQCFLGPIVSMLHDRFGTRIIVFAGSLVISISFVLSAFAPNIVYLYVVFGILGGIGMALGYLPAVIIISYYFDKRRSLATALGGIGGFAGCFVHPYLMQFFISIYGWRGALFVIGGLSLNSLAASLLLRPVSPSKKKSDKKLSVSVENETRRLETFIEENITGCNRQLDSLAEEDYHLKSPENIETVFTENAGDDEEIASVKSPGSSSASRPKSFSQGPKQRRSAPGVPTRAISERWGEQRSAPRFERHISEGDTAIMKDPALLLRRRKSSVFRSFAGVYTASVLHHQLSREAAHSVKSAHLAFVRRLSQVQRQAIVEEETIQEMPSLPPEAEQQTSKKDEPPDAKKMTRFAHFASLVGPWFDIFKNPEFTAFIVSNFLICLVFYTPSLFIVDWATQTGIEPEGATLLLSLVGVGNIIGRPVTAFFGDLLASYRALLFTLMVAIVGVATTVTPLFSSFYFLIFFVFQFSFLTGGSQTLLTPILADMVPLKRLGFAFGLVIAAEGTAMLIGPPILASFPSYALSITIAGLILVVSAVLAGVVIYANRLFSRCRLVKTAEESAES